MKTNTTSILAHTPQKGNNKARPRITKVALQLLNYPLKSDNLEKLGACSVSIGTIEELDGYLKKIVDANNLDEFRAKFNNDYIETRYNPTERFLEIISEIEEKKE